MSGQGTTVSAATNSPVAENGNSEISAEDYAIAIADLLEQNAHTRERVTAAW